MNDTFCGWHNKCIKKDNELVQIVISNREISKSKESEIRLKSIYAKLCGKGKGTYDVDDETHAIDSDSEDDDIGGFDGFAGDIKINNVSQIEAV